MHSLARLAAALLVVAFLVPGTAVMAQSPSLSSVVLIPVTESGFGVSSVVPEGWSSVGPGLHARSSSASDPTILGIQSAAATGEQLLASLMPQLGLTVQPAPVGTDTTAAGLVWTLYQAVNESRGIVADLGLAELDGRTNLVLLVSPTAEAGTLRREVFLPAVAAFQVSSAAASPVASPGPIGYTDLEVSFTGGAADVVLAGTLSVPDGPGPFPGIVLLSGSGPQDRDESLAPLAAIKPFALIGDALARAGVAVLRFDDRGTAASTGDFASAVIEDFTADGAAALAFLRGRPEVDPDRVGMLGHSEGGIEVATLGARDPRIAFIVGMAAPVVDGNELLIAQNEAIVRAAGQGEDEAAAAGAFARKAYQAALAGDIDAVESVIRDYFGALYDRSTTDSDVTATERSDFVDRQVAAQLPILMSPWFLSLLRSSPVGDWQQVTVPVLALYGGKDVQVLAEQQVAALRPALVAAGNSVATIVTLPDANHLFQSARTGAVGEYGSLEQAFTPDFLPTLVDWVVGVTGSGVAP